MDVLGGSLIGLGCEWLLGDIARSFNKKYKKVFRVPEVLPAEHSAVRVMSLADGQLHTQSAVAGGL
jgi:hypothetical protein